VVLSLLWMFNDVSIKRPAQFAEYAEIKVRQLRLSSSPISEYCAYSASASHPGVDYDQYAVRHVISADRARDDPPKWSGLWLDQSESPRSSNGFGLVQGVSRVDRLCGLHSVVVLLPCDDVSNEVRMESECHLQHARSATELYRSQCAIFAVRRSSSLIIVKTAETQVTLNGH
jgi:hypothetical protein